MKKKIKTICKSCGIVNRQVDKYNLCCACAMILHIQGKYPPKERNEQVDKLMRDIINTF
jgi:hypothetical protein